MDRQTLPDGEVSLEDLKVVPLICEIGYACLKCRAVDLIGDGQRIAIEDQIGTAGNRFSKQRGQAPYQSIPYDLYLIRTSWIIRTCLRSSDLFPIQFVRHHPHLDRLRYGQTHRLAHRHGIAGDTVT